MSTAEAWPFIVARNASLDWRPILAPPFLIDARADYLLVTETSDPDPELPQPRTIEVESVQAGRLTIVFSTLPATSHLLGRQSEETLLDRFGRPMHIVDGLVLRGGRRGRTGSMENALDRVRAETLRRFPDFWEESDESTPPARSEPIPIDVAEQTGAPVARDDQVDFNSTRRLFLPVVLLIAVVLGASAWWWWRSRAT